MRKSIGIAVLIATAIVAWVMSGTWTGDNDDVATLARPTNAAAKSNENKTLNVLVEVQTLVAESRTRRIELRGRTEASRSVDLRAETAARVVAINAKKGAKVRAGQVIVELAMNDREAKLGEAKATVRQRQIEYDASQSLSERGYRAQTKHAEAAANLSRALAYQAKIELDISNTKIKAPFDGILDVRNVETGSYVSTNMTIGRIVDQDPYLVIGQVSEINVPFLRVGDKGKATLASGEVIEGRLRFIASTADQKTRTFRVEMEVANRDRRLRDGLTAEISVEVDERMAHHVSSAILTLNDEGELGVRSVDTNNKVKFYSVEIIDDTGDGVWLNGLPERVDVISVGQEFVREGDKVRIKRAEEANS